MKINSNSIGTNKNSAGATPEGAAYKDSPSLCNERSPYTSKAFMFAPMPTR
jgi:hypothetical protein